MSILKESPHDEPETPDPPEWFQKEVNEDGKLCDDEVMALWENFVECGKHDAEESLADDLAQRMKDER